MAFLTLKNIKKSYYVDKEAFPVLKGIDLSFDRGEFVSILGESGGGKSTLMNIIGGLDRQFEGQVTVDGQVLDHSKERQLDDYRRSTVGYIYQSYNLISHLTVLDNVLVALDMTTLSRESRRQRALQLLDQVGLSDQVNKHPNHLSGGQKQRVAIARALASDPQMIIADEPTGALDAENTQEVLSILDGIARDGKLVIAVTHSQEVANHGTRIVHLADGKIDGDVKLKDPYPLPQDTTNLQARPLPATAAYRTSFKHLMYNFWRNSLIMLGTAIGIFAVILFTGLGNGVNGYIQDQINSMANPRAITVFRNPSGKKMSQEQLQASLQNLSADPESMFISDHDIQRLRNLSNVDRVETGVMVPGFRLSYRNMQQSGTTMTTWNHSVTTSSIKQGHRPGNGEILLTKQQAIQLTSAKKYKSIIGKVVHLNFNWIDKNGKPVQISSDVKVSGLSDGASASTSLNHATMFKLLRDNDATTRANYVAVFASNLNNVQTVSNKIDNMRDNNNRRILGTVTVGSVLKTLNTYVHLASTILAAIAGISLLVSALMIIVTMYMSVSERTKEIGILRAIGASKKDVSRVFNAETLIGGGVAGFIGIAMTMLLNIPINIIVGNLTDVKTISILPPVGAVVLIIISIVLTLIAGLIPSRIASKKDPVEALRSE